jgi:hypothetical protein
MIKKQKNNNDGTEAYIVPKHLYKKNNKNINFPASNNLHTVLKVRTRIRNVMKKNTKTTNDSALDIKEILNLIDINRNIANSLLVFLKKTFKYIFLDTPSRNTNYG